MIAFQHNRTRAEWYDSECSSGSAHLSEDARMSVKVILVEYRVVVGERLGQPRQARRRYLLERRLVRLVADELITTLGKLFTPVRLVADELITALGKLFTLVRLVADELIATLGRLFTLVRIVADAADVDRHAILGVVHCRHRLVRISLTKHLLHEHIRSNTLSIVYTELING